MVENESDNNVKKKRGRKPGGHNRPLTIKEQQEKLEKKLEKLRDKMVSPETSESKEPVNQIPIQSNETEKFEMANPFPDSKDLPQTSHYRCGSCQQILAGQVPICPWCQVPLRWE